MGNALRGGPAARTGGPGKRAGIVAGEELFNAAGGGVQRSQDLLDVSGNGGLGCHVHTKAQPGRESGQIIKRRAIGGRRRRAPG
jgi:hypothetical protein